MVKCVQDEGDFFKKKKKKKKTGVDRVVVSVVENPDCKT